MTPNRINDYVALLNAFIDRSISTADFEQRYLEMFKNESQILPERVFSILDGLFGDVDAYCDDVAIRDASNLTEDQLRDLAAKALMRLRG